MAEQAGGGAYWDIERYRREAAAEPAEPDAAGARGGERLRLAFDANAVLLFGVALRTVLLSVLTLGIYRFWMVARLRRLYCGAIRIDGDPLEYSGTGIEKFLGFLLALVVLAAYLGLVNLGLTFLGLSLAAEDPVMLQLTLQLSAVSALPLIFYATYRGQRYLLARTRWRGIRFGLGSGAWGYTRRQLVWSLLTLATLGLAWPYQHFRGAKFITDRAFYGDQRFRQDGGWTELFAQWIWVYVVAGICGLLVWGVIANPRDTAAWVLGTLALSFGGLAIYLALMRYRAAAFQILWNNRALGQSRFGNDLSPGRVVGIHLGGGLAVVLCAGAIAGVAGLGLVMLAGSTVDAEAMAAAIATPTAETLAAALPMLLALGTGYLLFFALVFAFSQVFVTMRVMRVRVEGTEIVDPARLAASRQRPHDRAGEAGGFADALGVDLGAGL